MRDLSSEFSNSLIIVTVVNYKFNANRDRDYPPSTWTWIGHYLSFCARVTEIHFGFGPPNTIFFCVSFLIYKTDDLSCFQIQCLLYFHSSLMKVPKT